MLSRARVLIIGITLTTILPGVIVSFRTQLLEKFALIAGAEIASPDNQIKFCNNSSCRIEYYFKTHSPVKASSVWVGFHSAFLSGAIAETGESVDLIITQLLNRPPNWHQFHKYHVYKSNQFTLIAAAPVGRKKYGMDSKKVFVGSEGAIDALQTVHSLFNFHIYIALAAAVLILSAALRTSYIFGTISQPYYHTVITALLISACCILYSHVFDFILFGIGLPSGCIENSAKWLWGPSVLFLLIRSTQWATAGSMLYICILWAYGGFSIQTPPSFYLAYPVVVALISALSILIIFIQRAHKDRFLFIPISLLVHDALAINGGIPLASSTYLSPLAFTGWFAWRHQSGLLAILNLAKFGKQHEDIARQLATFRRMRSNNFNVSQNKPSEQLVALLAASLGSNRASLILFNKGQPTISLFKNGNLSTIRDGFTPPIFARVLQTGEEMFMVPSDELSAIRQRVPGQNTEDAYGGTYAIVTPITDGDRVIGAFAFTDFSSEQELLADSHFQNHAKDLIAIVKQEVTNIETAESHNRFRSGQKLQELIEADFIQHSMSSRNSRELFYEFGKAVNKYTDLRTVIFDFDSIDRKATYSESYGLPVEAKKLWEMEPFFASRENKLSPIAISVNETRSIYIEDIRTFFGFLKKKSVLALSASEATGFAVIPLQKFGDLVGLVFVIQPLSINLSREINDYKFLDKIVQTLSIQLYQNEIAAKSLRQEAVLKKLIEPALIENVLLRQEQGEQVSGVVENAFLFLLDLRGSTAASRRHKDPLDLAQRLSRIYERADSLVRAYGGYFEKGNGDGLLFTLKDEPGAKERVIALLLQLDSTLGEVAQAELGIDRTITVAHYGTIFRGIMGSSTRIAWDNCGADLIDTFDIEKLAKKVEGAVFAASDDFLEHIDSVSRLAVEELAIGTILFKENTAKVLLFDLAAQSELWARIRLPERHTVN